LDAVFPLEVQRYRCKECTATHSVLPSFCVPGHTYSAPLMGEALERYFISSHSYERVAQAVTEHCPQHTLVWSTVRRWVTAFRSRAEATLAAVTAALAARQPDHGLLSSREAEGADRRRCGATFLEALEALRRVSEGVTLGRGFHQRRFEFYNLWLFREQRTGLIG